MHWKTQLYASANRIADRFVGYPGVTAVAIGGSIARGATWRHSDLELCLVVESHIPELQYFNHWEGIGVEILQIGRDAMASFVDGFAQPDASLLQFPIQIYKCTIVHDPDRLLYRFKTIYDRHLFHSNVAGLKKEASLAQADRRLAVARERMKEDRLPTALAHLRIGLNELLMAYYWHHGILPRSQNRTLHLLKRNESRIGHSLLYDAYIAIYRLDAPLRTMKLELKRAQPAVYRLAESGWGSNASAFLRQAVDGDLEWGHDKSILFVYKWCAHVLQCGDEAKVIEPPQDADGEALHRFLNFAELDGERMSRFESLFLQARNAIEANH